MKGSEKVMAALQEAINMEYTLASQYQLDQCDVGRLGLSIEDRLGDLHEQCEDYGKLLVARLLFLEGSPVVAPGPAATHDDVGSIITSAIAAESGVIAKYAEFTKTAFEEGDMDNFHLFQHLSKWHRQGGNDNKGHLSWLQKQAWQFGKLGETGYIDSKV